jgi:hypothetical protein
LDPVATAVMLKFNLFPAEEAKKESMKVKESLLKEGEMTSVFQL